MTKNAIIIGASSGIGKALAIHLVDEGWCVGITGRRFALLEDIQASTVGDSVFIQHMDVTNFSATEKQFKTLCEKMPGDIDLVIISAGIGEANEPLDYEVEHRTIDTNVKAFVVVADLAFNYFQSKEQEKGRGHLVSISSIMALRGSAGAPAYAASKAFVSNYMDGLHMRAIKKQLDISFTDIKPGFVDTAMARGGDGMFWVATPEHATKQIMRAVRKKKKNAYVTARWRIIAWLMKILPAQVLARFL